MTDIVLGIRLKADGSDLVGQVKVSEEALKKLRAEANQNTSEAAKLNEEHKNLARTMGDSAGKIGAYTALWDQVSGAIVKAANAAKDYIKETALLAARHETLGVVMAVVGRNAGYSAAEMNNYSAAVQKAGITMIGARETVIKLAQANIDLSLASKLARAAQDAAVIANTNSSEALERLIHGITSGQTDVLRTMGINVSFEESYKKLSKTLGITTEQLTEQEKVQARSNVVLEYAVRLQGTYEAAMGTAGKQLNSLARYTEDLKTMRGEVWNDALIIAVEAYTAKLRGANEETKRLSHEGTLKEWGRDVVQVMAFVADAVNGVITVTRLAASGLATVAAGGVAAAKIANAANPARGGLLLNAGEISAAMNDYRRFAGAAGEEERRLLNQPTFQSRVGPYFAGRDAAATVSGDDAMDADIGIEISRRRNADTRAAEIASARANGGKHGGSSSDPYSAAQGMLNSLENQLQSLRGEGSEVDKVIREITEGSKQWTEALKANVLAVAGEIDLERKRAQDKKTSDDNIKSEVARIEEQMRLDEQLAAERRSGNVQAGGFARELGGSAAQINAQLSYDPKRTAYVEFDSQKLMWQERLRALNADSDARKQVEEQYAAWVVARTAQITEELKPNWQKQVEAYGDAMRSMREFNERFVTAGLRAGENAFIEWARTGKLSVKDLFGTLRDEIARTLYQQQIAKPASTLLSGLAGQLTSFLFGSSYSNLAAAGGGVGGTNLSLDSYDPPLVGKFAEGTDYVPATGLALVHQGERIIPAAENAKGSAPQSMRVEIVNQGAPKAVQSATPRFDMEGMMLRVVMKDIESGGAVARSMEGLYGLNRAAGAAR